MFPATWGLQKSIKHSEIKHKIQKDKFPPPVEKLELRDIKATLIPYVVRNYITK
jgi:hypothetical protein